MNSYDGHDPIKASEHQLKEAEASIDKLHSKSLILLDDKGSKTNLSIEFYQKKDLTLSTKLITKFYFPNNK